VVTSSSLPERICSPRARGLLAPIDRAAVTHERFAKLPKPRWKLINLRTLHSTRDRAGGQVPNAPTMNIPRDKTGYSWHSALSRSMPVQSRRRDILSTQA
jgi:hypothetical protein